MRSTTMCSPSRRFMPGRPSRSILRWRRRRSRFQPAHVPVVADFLAAAWEEFKFAPRQPQSEAEFKRAYARVALAAGLGKQQIVRIYSFEAGGNGGYDVQAGLEHDKSARAITTALGYNQLLATNSVEVVAESGPHFVKALAARAAALPGPRKPRSKARSRSCAK